MNERRPPRTTVDSNAKWQQVSRPRDQNRPHFRWIARGGNQTGSRQDKDGVCEAYPVVCVLHWGKALNKEAAVTL